MADTATTIPTQAIIVKDDETFMKFVLWQSIPPFIKRPPSAKNGATPTPREFAESMGIDDPEILELCELTNQRQFAERFACDQGTLSDWKKKLKQRDVLADCREWGRALSRNMLTSLYNHAIRKGNPLNIKLWFQIMNGWKEESKVEMDYKGVTQFTVIHNGNGNKAVGGGEGTDDTLAPAPEVLREGDSNTSGTAGTPA